TVPSRAASSRSVLEFPRSATTITAAPSRRGRLHARAGGGGAQPCGERKGAAYRPDPGDTGSGRLSYEALRKWAGPRGGGRTHGFKQKAGPRGGGWTHGFK